VRHLIAAFAMLLVGCAQTVPPGPTQALSGAGWDLVSVGAIPLSEGVFRIEPVTGGLLVEMQTSGAGNQGCGAPTFAGFDVVGDAIVGRIVRGPTFDDPQRACLSTSSVVFAVRLHTDAIPDGVTKISMSEPCGLPGCADDPLRLP
jgi:hypothetical protein